MTKCIIIYGQSKSGKSYTAKFISKNFSVKQIKFDHIMAYLTESIRNFYENKDSNHKSILYKKNIFDSNSELDEFLHEFESIIENNQKFCENVYLNYIKDVRPDSSFRPGIDEFKDVINLGLVGIELDPLGDEIMNLVLKFFIKDSQTVLFDGIYFGHDTSYRKKIEDNFDKIANINTFYDEKDNVHYYEYNGSQLKSINQIIINLKNNKFVSQKSIIEKDVHTNKKITVIKLVKKFFKPLRKSKEGVRKYQIFELTSEGDSPSHEKIKILGIPKNLSNKYVLDLGCNEGYYCFECEKLGAYVVGVERNKKWFDLGMKRKNEFSSNVIFKNISWDHIYSLNNKFDLVLFLAAFHYLKGNQLEMLKKIFKKMNPEGLLIIEMGLSSKNNGNFYIDELKRPSGEICQYPNIFSLKKLLVDAGFRNPIIYGRSIDIKGDPVPRYVTHARK